MGTYTKTPTIRRKASEVLQDLEKHPEELNRESGKIGVVTARAKRDLSKENLELFESFAEIMILDNLSINAQHTNLTLFMRLSQLADCNWKDVDEVTYNKEKEVDVKLFFSTDKDEWSTFVRNYREKVKDNFIRLKIEPSRRTHSSLISGGNYDFSDDFDAGYSLRVSMKYSDDPLISKIASVLRDNDFGCLPSTKFTLDAHRNFEHPTEHEAEKILASITDMVCQKLT